MKSFMRFIKPDELVSILLILLTHFEMSINTNFVSISKLELHCSPRRWHQPKHMSDASKSKAKKRVRRKTTMADLGGGLTL